MEIENRLKQLDPKRKGLNRILNRDRVIRNYNPKQTKLQPARVYQVENWKVKRKKSHLGPAVFVLGTAVLGLSAMYAPDVITGIRFIKAKNQAIEQYGDANGDRFVSAEENKELFQNIFYKTGITFNSEGAKYSDGKQVPTSELTGIIKNYIDNPVRE